MGIFANDIRLEDKELLQQYLKGYRYCTSGLSFSSLYMWRDINEMSWEIFGDYMCIVGMAYLEMDKDIILPFMQMPLTRTGSYDTEKLRETVLMAKEKIEDAGYPFTMRLVPFPLVEELEKAFPGQLTVKADRDNYDYLYDRMQLIELKGRAFHKKKNHMNYFMKNYQYEYKEMTSDMADDAMRFIGEFNDRKETTPYERELLLMEERAMRDVFEHLETAGYKGGVIYIDGRIQALSVGGQICPNTFGVHIEKANTEYRGLYQVINKEFCMHMDPSVKFMNREEDMGLPGLRKAKLSYQPVKLVEKYIVNFRE